MSHLPLASYHGLSECVVAIYAHQSASTQQNTNLGRRDVDAATHFRVPNLGAIGMDHLQRAKLPEVGLVLRSAFKQNSTLAPPLATGVVLMPKSFPGEIASPGQKRGARQLAERCAKVASRIEAKATLTTSPRKKGVTPQARSGLSQPTTMPSHRIPNA
jgi:hypothetical protein